MGVVDNSKNNLFRPKIMPAIDFWILFMSRESPNTIELDKCNLNISNFSHGKKGRSHLRELPGIKNCLRAKF